MFRRAAFLTTAVVLCTIAFGQSSSTTVVMGNSAFYVNPNGTLFTAPDSSVKHEYPVGSGNNMMGFSGFWIGAKDASGNIYTTISTGTEDDEFWPGPIDTVTGLAKDPADWSFVWVVAKQEIDSHRISWKKAGYVVPASISKWPARHSGENLRAHLAPYADFNGNGVYDPENGDYPVIKGDIAAYYIANDGFGEHITSGGLKLSLEIHGMLYGFESGPDTNTLFHEMVIVNRSSNTYDSVMIGRFHKVVLGNDTDNRMGTWVNRRTVYSYNGDENDEGHYGDHNPMIAVVGLDAHFTYSMSFSDKDADRKVPFDKDGFWNALKSLWYDSQPLTYGGDGRGGTVKTRWIYPGNTDPFQTTPWWDENSKDGPGKRNMLAVYGPFNLPPAGYIVVNTAMIWQTDADTTVLGNRINGLLSRYGQVLSVDNEVVTGGVSFFPNPVKTGQELSIAENVTSLAIYSATGQLAMLIKNDKKVKKSCSIMLPVGVYWVKATTEGREIRSKLLVTR